MDDKIKEVERPRQSMLLIEEEASDSIELVNLDSCPDKQVLDNEGQILNEDQIHRRNGEVQK